MFLLLVTVLITLVLGQDQTKDVDSLIQALKDNGNDVQESAAEALQKLEWQSDS